MERKNNTDLKEYVESKRVTNMMVSSIPLNIYMEFKEFAVNMAGDNYALAIKILMDSYNFSLDKAIIDEMSADIFELKNIVSQLVDNHTDNTKTEEDEIHTFGQRNKKAREDRGEI